MKNKINFFIVLSAVIILLSCNREKSEVKTGTYSQFGGRMVISSISDPKSFNPIMAKETSTTRAIGWCFEGLTETDGVTTEVKPCLAESWQISADGLEWVFKLRSDVKWFDGKQFSADDVVFTFEELIYNDDIPSSSRDIFTIDGKKIKTVKIDDFNVKFILPKPFAPFLRQLAQEILPKHILERSVKDKKFTSTWGVNTNPVEIIGTGPFYLKEYVSSQKVVLEKNPYYWRKDKEGKQLPYLDQLVILIVPDQDADLLKFQSGEIDILAPRGQDYSLLKGKEKEGNFKLYNCGPTFGTNFLVFNQNPKALRPPWIEWFTNVEFRRAVAHLIDKNSIINNVMSGLAYPQNSAMEKAAVLFYNDNVRKYDYNIPKAKEILLNAGFKDKNKDGFLEDKKGNTVEFTILTNSENKEREQIGNIIVDDLRKAGLKVNYAPIQFNTLVNKLDNPPFDWDAILIGLTGGVEPHSGMNVWMSSGQLHMWYPRQNKPETAWEKEIDELFTRGASELNEEKRRQIYFRWQEIAAEQLPFIYTVNPAAIYAVRNKFGNLNPTAYGGTTHNIWEIYISK